MKKLLALLLGLSISTTAIADVSGDFQTISIENGLDRNERRVREAAVKITDGRGHGSGGIVQYYDLQLVLTAQHVADGRIGSNYFVINGATMERAILVYSDPVHDIALLYLAEGNQLEGRGLRYSPTSDMSGIGTGITYSRHPSWHSLMTYRGHIAGLEHLDGRGPQLMINTYGWFGCSGSVIYNTSGDIIGILWGVDIEQRPDLQVQENMIWVSPIQNLDMSLAISELCIALEDEPRACRK
ncbi:MAG TPA: hypothetical protein DCG23_00155 [Deltaproteobacteria bacterium]|nr:hypothetical protein [Deltaproteobacteria bacterium]